MNFSWFINEPEHAGPEHLDPFFVSGYDQKQAFDPTPDVDLLKSLGIGPYSTLLDFGAGTGTFALAIAPYVKQVVAVDVSPVMLEHIQRRADDRGLSNVQCGEAGFLSYEHVGPPADAIYTRNALHHLPDFWKSIALVRMAGMLTSRGHLVIRDLIYDFAPQETEAVFQQLFDQAATDSTRGYTRADFVEHIQTEFSTYRWLFEPIIHHAGFDIETADFARRMYGAYTCVKR